MKNLGFIIVIAVFVFMSCNDDDPVAEQLEEDIQLIEAYLETNNLNAQSTSSGLHYIIEKEGNGTYPMLTSIVEVNYKGTLLNGTVFDQGTVSEYPLYGYIQGWHEGIQLFSEGGKGTLFIPSKLGYGTIEKANIPANSVLIFDIQLISVAN